MSRTLLTVLLLVPGLLASSEPRGRRVILWAWERPEDLRFLPPGVGVTYLAATVTIGREVSLRPRMQPLRVPDHVTPRPIVRIEARSGGSLAALTAAQREELVSLLIAAARGGPSLQLDFDARESETAAYLELLLELRARAPGSSISITALASWCEPGSFLERAPVAEVVPQLFRMGRGAGAHRARAERFTAPCVQSVGLALDESLAVPAAARTVYLFNPKPWTAESFELASKKVLR